MVKRKKTYLIKKSRKKGKGTFATRDIKKGELIMMRDYSKLKRYKLGDRTLRKSNHVDYVGNKEYVIDKSPNSYINHSCNPNTKTVAISKNKAKNYAIKNIRKGEELTHSYVPSKKELAQAKKQGLYIWKMKKKRLAKKEN
ncbi:unnamed protein product [marine sediment metagenome]|uniref:SET domain-containing protein n=1 Tax=marine sediment metagenome TaxID=412755 RepID=X1NJY8_9ZZZZ